MVGLFLDEEGGLSPKCAWPIMTFAGAWIGRWAVPIYSFNPRWNIIWNTPPSCCFCFSLKIISWLQLHLILLSVCLIYTHTLTGVIKPVYEPNLATIGHEWSCVRVLPASRATTVSDPCAPGWILSSPLKQFRLGILTKPLRPAL